MNDIPQATDYFDFILYADDTSLYSKIQTPVICPIDINNELSSVYNRLAVSKLSLNIKKTKYMGFHAINKNIEDSYQYISTRYLLKGWVTSIFSD